MGWSEPSPVADEPQHRALVGLSEEVTDLEGADLERLGQSRHARAVFTGEFGGRAARDRKGEGRRARS